MPRPDSPISLIAAVDQQLMEMDWPFEMATTPFPYEGWQAAFQSYAWFRVVGMRRLASAAAFFDLSELDKYWERSGTDFPKSWIPHLPMPIQRQTAWNKLGANQLDRALSGLRIRFDAACRAIFCLELACVAQNKSLNIYSPGEDYTTTDKFGNTIPLPAISIRPIIYKLQGFDETYYTAIRANQNAYHRLRAATSQWSRRKNVRDKKTYNCVFHETSSGHCMTHSLAIDAAMHLSTEDKDTKFTITNISSRKETYLERATELEEPRYPWSVIA